MNDRELGALVGADDIEDVVDCADTHTNKNATKRAQDHTVQALIRGVSASDIMVRNSLTIDEI